MRQSIVVKLAQLAEFDEIIDVRSPAEFEDDHIPGAVNRPVLDDSQRAEIGTLYKQVSPFDARKRGAALVTQNISLHLLNSFADRDRSWKPLVYCWRGGKRSEAMALVMRQVGWNAAQLEGGYKSYRREVIAALSSLPPQLHYVVVCGSTGCGKSRLLRALAAAGSQVLDLEALARHRGSVLGDLPNLGQPSQKTFDSAVWDALRGFDARRVVFIEAESKKIGNVRVPERLVHAMWASPCIRLELPFSERVSLLMDEYRHFFAEPDELFARLDFLDAMHGKNVIDSWKSLARSANWRELVAELLNAHYDPAYRKSATRNYPQLAEAMVIECRDGSDGEMERAARDLLKSIAARKIPT